MLGKGVALTPPYPRALCRREMNAQDVAFLLSLDAAPENADAVASVAGVGPVTVNVVWDPPWDQSRMSDEARVELNMW